MSGSQAEAGFLKPRVTDERGPQELVWGGPGLEPAPTLTSGAEQAGFDGALGTVKHSALFCKCGSSG